MDHPGLTTADARRRLVEDGPNQIRRQAPTPPWRIFLRQFQSPMVALLAAAAGIAVALDEPVDAIAIVFILLVNGVVGFVQEYRAQSAVLALRALTAPRARVLRDGRATVLPAEEVVRDDLLLLEAGDLVAADALLLEAHALASQEAALTGESLPVRKSIDPVPDDAPLAERTNRVYAGTAIASGTGVARVAAVGMATELGKIAHLLDTAQEESTPLQQQLDRVSRWLILACVAVVLLVAALGVWRGQAWLEVLLGAVSLAVAAVPEGLPAVVTIALAVGVQRMARRNVLVRRLPAVETLGAATVVCTDKTGTLTVGEMTLREVWGADERRVLEVAAGCCDAELSADGESGVGDPTEVAILVAAARRGVHRSDIERSNPRLRVNPFDGDRKRMSVYRADGVLYVKGAVDQLAPLCVEVPDGLLDANAAMAARGLRVLGVAVGERYEEAELRIVGLLGLADPPRSEAVQAVADARKAGITTVMITGDHPITARAIAAEMGVLREDEPAHERVHARATPEDKLRIVRGWKEKGAVVAMTGDGVNDAPALREAHIGIAMGITGTEVTREAADMVLADDNFASIIAAVREGRAIYANIRKTLVYLLTGNVGELVLMFGAALVALPVPLLPLHLLWINLVTDGLPALALVIDPPAADVLDRPPRPPGAPILGRREFKLVLLGAGVEAAVALATFWSVMQRSDLDHARSLTFAVVVFSELLRAFAARSSRKVFWQTGPLTNWRLLGVVAFTLSLQVLIYAWAPARALFDLVLLTPREFALAFGLGLIPVTVLELAKLVRRG